MPSYRSCCCLLEIYPSESQNRRSVKLQGRRSKIKVLFPIHHITRECGSVTFTISSVTNLPVSSSSFTTSIQSYITSGGDPKFLIVVDAAGTNNQRHSLPSIQTLIASDNHSTFGRPGHIYSFLLHVAHDHAISHA